MDLLGSILNAMDKPPETNQKQKEIMKKQNEQIEKMKNREKEELNRFRRFAEERIDRISKDDSRKFIQFQPLDKVYRSVVHDVAEVAGLLAMSFGQEGVDRYVIVYKKECSPSEDEIHARRNGEEWNDDKAKEYAQRRLQKKLADEEKAKKPEKIVPHSNYKDKYVHLIGQESALEAAKKTESNKLYGFVPSENKRDIRSIEQTMADIQAKKRLKLEQHPTDNLG
ncbi:Sperm-associated antigen 7 [Pseudolycoriella hygida]|uniref:Sperm-associated antigen 7 n=1 Tax=Pseudolycoriella hygida TaxID=35572 RepID=A0A9Q0MNL3_9DIPT|nr:Sperm-associated antigen 7 [Pseudolycoriella hygida]